MAHEDAHELSAMENYERAIELYETFEVDPAESLVSDAIAHIEASLIESNQLDKEVAITAKYNRCLMIIARHKHFGSRADELDEVIEQLESIAFHEDHSVVDRIWNTLGSSLEDRFELNPALHFADLRRATFWMRKSLFRARSKQSEDLWMREFGHGMILQTSYSVEKDDLALMEAEQCFINSLNLRIGSGDGQSLSVIHNALANNFDQRYKHQGRYRLKLLEKAYQHAKLAVEFCPATSRSKLGRLSSIGRILERFYQTTGNLDILIEALEYSTEAITLLKPQNPNASSWLHNLSMLSLSVYNRTGAIEDLNSAISLEFRSLRHTADWNQLYADRLGALGTLHTHKFERSRDMHDLDLSIRFDSEALSLVNGSNRHRSMYLNNLGNQLVKRFQITKSETDIWRSVQCFDEAISISTNSENRLGYWNNMSRALQSKFDLSHDVQLLATSIQLLSFGLKEAVPHHPLRSQALSTIAAEYIDLAKYYSPDHWTQHPYTGLALTQLIDAFQNDSGDPLQRIQVAHVASDVLISRQRLDEAYDILKSAYMLLPLVTARSLDLEDQEQILSKLTNLVSTLTSVILAEKDDIDHALEVLDGGRGVILGHLLKDDAAIALLKQKGDDNVSLANEYTALRTDLETPTNPSNSDLSNKADTRRKIEATLHKVEEKIRLVPGLEDFHTPLDVERMKLCAKGKIIVVINVNHLRADAFIVTQNSTISFELETVIYEEVIQHVRDFRRRVLKAKPNQQNKLMRESLMWLWSHVVSPVFEFMQLKPASTGYRRPEITWICVGVMSNAPIHAATDYQAKDRSQTTLRYCIPAYAPTIRTIHSALKDTKELDMQEQQVKLLGIKMEYTPGKNSPLMGLDKEFEAAKKFLPAHSIHSILPQPSANQVLLSVPSYQIVHFACHGEFQGDNPSKSRLLLQKEPNESGSLAMDPSTTLGATDSLGNRDFVSSKEVKPLLDELTVAAISKLHLPDSKLAILLACNSAANEAAPLADESLHIASMMQVAGFKHVIGTLWEAENQTCISFATEFYKLLFTSQESSGVKDPSMSWRDRIPAAYCRAIEVLQEQHWKAPLIWAPFVHFG